LACADADNHQPRKEGPIMSVDLGFIEHFAHWRIAELQREAANDRLARQASRPGRPWRSQVAGWLYAVADRLDGNARQVAPANA
jgi:hypothetical protein